jgi:hypothetical protein
VAGPFGYQPGGIQSLLTLPKEQWEAIEADAVAAGWHVSDLNWREIAAMVKHSDRGSALYKVVHGEKAAWSITDHLLAMLVDLMQILVWFKTKDGSKGRNRPKPLPRPGEGPQQLSSGDVNADGVLKGDGTFRVGSAMTIEELDALLGR